MYLTNTGQRCRAASSLLICMYMYIYIYIYYSHTNIQYNHACRGKGLQHLLSTTKCAFALLYIFWNLDYHQKFPLNILKPGLSPEIPTQIDWNLAVQNTTFWRIEVSSKPSPLHPWDVYLTKIFTHVSLHLKTAQSGNFFFVDIHIHIYIYVYIHTNIQYNTCISQAYNTYTNI